MTDRPSVQYMIALGWKARPMAAGLPWAIAFE